MNFDNNVENKRFGVLPIPALRDNYMYLIWCRVTKNAAIVDPVDPRKVMSKCRDMGLSLKAGLTTHHHHDHAGGNADLKKLHPSIKIYGGKGDNAKAVECELWEGDDVKLGELQVNVLATPCHTRGHICYYIGSSEKDGPGAVFTGDTLFVAGAGNFFEGTPKQMNAAFSKLGKLPMETYVYVGHEYTTTNLSYASHVEPKNKDISDKLNWAEGRRAKGLYTIPSTIAEEHATNPFLRTVLEVNDVMNHAGTKDPVEAMYFVRTEKSAGRWKKK